MRTCQGESLGPSVNIGLVKGSHVLYKEAEGRRDVGGWSSVDASLLGWGLWMVLAQGGIMILRLLCHHRLGGGFFLDLRKGVEKE